METLINLSSTEFEKFASLKQGDLWMNPKSRTALVITKLSKTSPEDFQELLSVAAVMIRDNFLTRLVFDQSSLCEFHQDIMEWHYLKWKNQMYTDYGLLDHMEILPKDSYFRLHVEISRNRIFNRFPETNLRHIRTSYHESVEEILGEKHYSFRGKLAS